MSAVKQSIEEVFWSDQHVLDSEQERYSNSMKLDLSFASLHLYTVRCRSFFEPHCLLDFFFTCESVLGIVAAHILSVHIQKLQSDP